MLRVTVPDFQKPGKWITYDAPESSEPMIREYIINQHPPEVQIECRIETIAETPRSTTQIIEPPKPQPKTQERIKLEERAAELGILGISLYDDVKLLERIKLKEEKLKAAQPVSTDTVDLAKEKSLQEVNNKPVIKKRGRPSTKNKTVA